MCNSDQNICYCENITVNMMLESALMTYFVLKHLEVFI